MYRRTFLLTIIATITFAATHSLLASLAVKTRVRTLVGERTTDGLYRFGFCGIAVLSLIGMMRAIWNLPDRTLYRVRGFRRNVIIFGQIVVAAVLIETNRRNQFERVTGIGHVQDLLAGRPIRPPAVAQHPLPDGERLEGWGGPFRLSSHPNNYGVLMLYLLFPTMTVKWAAVGVVTVVYMVLGLLHEDHRLRHAYGDRYERYRQSVPHLWLFPVDVWGRRRG